MSSGAVCKHGICVPVQAQPEGTATYYICAGCILHCLAVPLLCILQQLSIACLLTPGRCAATYVDVHFCWASAPHIKVALLPAISAAAQARLCFCLLALPSASLAQAVQQHSMHGE